MSPDVLENMLRRVVREELSNICSPALLNPVLPVMEPDFQRAKRAALEAREKSSFRRKNRSAAC